MRLALDEIVQSVSGTVSTPPSGAATGYSIDSRTVAPGDLFFAIPGPRFDGHDFVAEAFRRGATAAVVERDVPAPGPTVRVPSSLAALQQLALHVRRRWGRTIVGVTGSAGKTTTKEMTAAVLGTTRRILKSQGNFNNAYGLPLCLLRVEESHDMAVLEMGMSAPGEILALTAVAEPDQGIVTNVHPVHLQFFDSVDGIARAKFELLEGLRGQRIAYLNQDDPRVRAMSRRFDGTVVTYGVRTTAAFRAVNVRHLGLDGSSFTIRNGRREVHFRLPVLGRLNIINAVAAVAAGITNGVDWKHAVDALGRFHSGKMRGEVIRLRDGITLINDAYNSNPRALSEMIRFVRGLRGRGRRILVAGEMLELGPAAAAFHQSCGREAAQAGFGLIIGVRGHASDLVQGALAAGMDKASTRFAADADEAAEILTGSLKLGDVVLIKGSRGVQLDRVVDRVRRDFEPQGTKG